MGQGLSQSVFNLLFDVVLLTEVLYGTLHERVVVVLPNDGVDNRLRKNALSLSTDHSSLIQEKGKLKPVEMLYDFIASQTIWVSYIQTVIPLSQAWHISRICLEKARGPAAWGIATQVKAHLETVQCEVFKDIQRIFGSEHRLTVSEGEPGKGRIASGQADSVHQRELVAYFEQDIDWQR